MNRAFIVATVLVSLTLTSFSQGGMPGVRMAALELGNVEQSKREERQRDEDRSAPQETDPRQETQPDPPRVDSIVNPPGPLDPPGGQPAGPLTWSPRGVGTGAASIVSTTSSRPPPRPSKKEKAFQRKQDADAIAGCEWDCGTLGGIGTPRSVRVGKADLQGDPRRFALVTKKLKASVKMVKDAGVVVYAPVETVKGVAIVRFETRGNGLAPRQDVRQTDVTWKDFVSWIKAARQPTAEGVREELKQLLPTHVEDEGKSIFIKDYFNCGLIPASLGLEGVNLATSNVPDGVRKRQIVQSNMHLEDFAVFSGYPETAEDYGEVFRNPQNAVAPLATWQGHARELRTIAEKQGLPFIGANDVGTPTTKAGLLARLAKSKGIVFIVAHAEGFHIRLPGKTEMSITPTDIRGLKLNGAVVVLRICNGADQGYPQAFIDAGATAVWANYGVINAADANRHIKLFFEALRSGSSVAAAIKTVEETDPTARTSTALFSELTKHKVGGLGDVEA